MTNITTQIVSARSIPVLTETLCIIFSVLSFISLSVPFCVVAIPLAKKDTQQEARQQIIQTQSKMSLQHISRIYTPSK